jgi:hypothetical protein
MPNQKGPFFSSSRVIGDNAEDNPFRAESRDQLIFLEHTHLPNVETWKG